jgi:hypothetical protein
MATTPQTMTSVDRLALKRWQFNETNGFVVKDYTGIKEGDEPVVMVLKASDIFDYIAEASTRKAKIAIYAIGPCVIDWS